MWVEVDASADYLDLDSAPPIKDNVFGVGRRVDRPSVAIGTLLPVGGGAASLAAIVRTPHVRQFISEHTEYATTAIALRGFWGRQLMGMQPEPCLRPSHRRRYPRAPMLHKDISSGVALDHTDRTATHFRGTYNPHDTHG